VNSASRPVQATPVYLDRAATLDVVTDHITSAGADGANLVGPSKS
jgi:hypothetical protein